jgi:hypothetical protein
VACQNHAGMPVTKVGRERSFFVEFKMADFKSISLAFFIISAGISSIGVSSWQYQVVDNGITFYNSYTLQTESLSTMCSDFPYEYLRRKYFQNLNILD